MKAKSIGTAVTYSHQKPEKTNIDKRVFKKIDKWTK